MKTPTPAPVPVLSPQARAASIKRVRARAIWREIRMLYEQGETVDALAEAYGYNRQGRARTRPA